jgi:tRNA threonylcarbamoyladenosine biosynthesis protein TsaE
MQTDTNGALELQLPDEAATLELGRQLAAVLQPGLIVYLSGELGAGKTTLVRGTLHALGHVGPVKSPTYTLVELYNFSRLYLHHFDFYRFKQSDDLEAAGFRDVFDGTNVCLVEWPEKAAGDLPAADLHIRLHHVDGGRRASVRAETTAGLRCLERLTMP